MTRYFTPQDGDGLQQFVQGGTAPGWYQFNRVGISVPALPGITIPQGATGICIQAVTDLRYCQSPAEAQGGTTAYMTLTAGSYLWLPGQEAIYAFCVLLTGTATTFTVQFYEGDIGPAPWIHQPSTGGVIPPPPPGIGAVPTINVVHVMKNTGGQGGDDATGTRNRLDLPFLTIAAAQAAMQEGDTMVIWPGTYTAANLGDKSCTYMLLGADIQDDGSGNGIIYMEDGKTVRVIGSGMLLAVNGAEQATLQEFASTLILEVDIYADGNISPAVFMNATDAILRVRGTIESTGWALETAGDCEVYGQVISGGGYETCLCDSGRQLIYGSVRSAGTGDAIICFDGIQEVHGTVTGEAGRAVRGISGEQIVHGRCTSLSGSAPVAENSGANQVIYGDCIHEDSGVAAVQSGVGTQTIYGDVLAADAIGANCTAGTQTIIGDVQGGSGFNAANCTNGEQTINGDCTATGAGHAAAINGTGTQNVRGNCTAVNGAAARCADGLQVIVGDCATTGAEIAAYMNGGGQQRITGRVSAANNYAAVCVNGTQVINGDCVTAASSDGGALCQAGTQVIHGNCQSTGGGQGATCNGVGTQTIYGTCISLVSAAARCDAGTQNIYGDCISTSSQGHFASGGTSVLHGIVSSGSASAAFARNNAVVKYMSQVVTGSAVQPAIEIGSGSGAPSIELFGGCYLKTGGGNSITDPTVQSPTVRSYGAYATNAVDGTVTIAGTLNILP